MLFSRFEERIEEYEYCLSFSAVDLISKKKERNLSQSSYSKLREPMVTLKEFKVNFFLLKIKTCTEAASEMANKLIWKTADIHINDREKNNYVWLFEWDKIRTKTRWLRRIKLEPLLQCK